MGICENIGAKTASRGSMIFEILASFVEAFLAITVNCFCDVEDTMRKDGNIRLNELLRLDLKANRRKYRHFDTSSAINSNFALANHRNRQKSQVFALILVKESCFAVPSNIFAYSD